ncbi:methyltransferase [Bacillus cereus group sp. TH152-1LC]|uniref:methyltransferase n=1 Tax=Bacillus cereus group sp. TH152-1LC TaxID=3018060 RepID=UPI0022E202F9|nr:methyltransferase [Bacillus cereus group sp. TH152-1LC]MDA1679947.1 methyltransferase [Bacillus cereus group sp. TH152-1LC]
MKMKRKIMMTTALAATLATGALPSTSVFAAEKEAPIQQKEAQMSIQPLAQNNLETAVNAALNGPEVKKIKVFEHEFNVKEIEVVNLSGGKKYVKGQISHHLSFRPDDQFYYEFTVQDGKVVDKPVFNIDRGGWTPFAAPLLSILAAYNGIPVNPNDLNALGQQLGKVIDGSWEHAAQSIATVVSLSFNE